MNSRHPLLKLSVFTILTLSAMGANCEGINNHDYYSEVVSVCNYTLPGGTPTLPAKTATPEEMAKTTLTPECKKALESILPYDETWDQAPLGLKDKITEGFQVILAYPLAIPAEHRILGAGPYAIPTSHLCVFAPQLFPEDCPLKPAQNEQNWSMSQRIFNYILNHTDRITYTGPDTYAAARYNIFGIHCPSKSIKRTIEITDNFWSAEYYVDATMTPFLRAGTLIHESRHGDGIVHLNCSDGKPGCDQELLGSYGIELTYNTLLLHGSARIKNAGKYVLSNRDVELLGWASCIMSQKNVLNLPPELDALLDPTKVKCGRDVTWLWVLDQEGISR